MPPTAEIPSVLGLARRVASKIRLEARTSSERLDFCRRLLSVRTRDERLQPLCQSLSKLPVDERHYWVGTFYTLLLTPDERRAQAAYFTPPHLSKAIVSQVRKEGFDPSVHRVMDPAAGGAAFLSTIAAEMRLAGVTGKQAVSRLTGIEIDLGLARLSETLISERLGVQVDTGSIVERADALQSVPSKKYDLVVANPPYGRLSLSGQADDSWEDVCHPGHINKYALFTKRCFEFVRPGGLVALVIPSSFIAGPLYDRLRTFLRANGEVLSLGSVVNRDDVFVDVAQDVCVLLARAGVAHRPRAAVAYGHFSDEKSFRAVSSFTLPSKSAEPWSLPVAGTGLPVGGCTLEDYGISLRSGYFVWNREKSRMKTNAKAAGAIPLIWARNIAVGKLCRPAARKRKGVDYVTFNEHSEAIVTEPALMLQRTTNSAQPRRLIAARVAPEVYERWGGFVSENHTIVGVSDGSQRLPLVCRLLNSAAVDARYRQLSGTASVSVTLLRTLDLPDPAILEAEARKTFDFEKAVANAYAKSQRLAATG